MNSWGLSGKYSKNYRQTHLFLLIFYARNLKNPQISQIQQENITNGSSFPENSLPFQKEIPPSVKQKTGYH
jgi:hypothetical protein